MVWMEASAAIDGVGANRSSGAGSDWSIACHLLPFDLHLSERRRSQDHDALFEQIRPCDGDTLHRLIDGSSANGLRSEATAEPHSISSGARISRSAVREV